MSSGWDNYREDIDNKWLLETPYNALQCITKAKLERYELLKNRKLSYKEREEMGFEFNKLLSPLKMNTKESYVRPRDSKDHAGGYSSWDLCFHRTGSEEGHVIFLFYPEYYVYDFYNFKEHKNCYDFSFKKFLDILGHDLIPHAYYGLIVPEIEKGVRIIDRRYFIQEYELLRRMVFISRQATGYGYDESAMEHHSSYLYDIYFNNATETTVKRYEESEKEFNSAVERFKNEEEVFYYRLPDSGHSFGITYKIYFSARDNEYGGEYYSSMPYIHIGVRDIPIKKVKCMIVNKFGGLNFLNKPEDTNKNKEYFYQDFGSFILNDGTLLNENSIFITFDDFIDSNDTIEDINNKLIRRNDLYDLLSPILKEPSKSEFADYKSYLDNIIPNPPAKYGFYRVTISKKLYLGNDYTVYDHNEGKRVLIDSYAISCYDYLAGGELEFDDDGLYSSGDSSSDANEEKDTTDNIETNNNTES